MLFIHGPQLSNVPTLTELSLQPYLCPVPLGMLIDLEPSSKGSERVLGRHNFSHRPALIYLE